MSLNLRSVMCVPLISYGKAIGAIYVENRSVRGRFKEENLVPLLLFANQSSVAIENAVQNDDLEARVAERTQALAETNATGLIPIASIKPSKPAREILR